MAAARAGQPQVLLVEGEAGIGKSRLVRDALDRLGAPDDVVVVGHGVDVMGGELPFGVVTGALRDLIRRVGVDVVRSAGEGGLAALNFLVPGLLDEPSAPPDRLRVFDAFATLLARLSHRELTWFVIEDLHWADTSSRDLLSYVLRTVDDDAHLLTVCTLRTQDTAAHMSAELFADELGRLPNARTVRLSRLDRDEVADFLRELSQEQPTGPLLEQVVALSNGVPFLVEELVAAGVDESGSVPESVAATMLRRISNLQPDTRTLVRIASLGESHLQHDRLAEVCGLDEERLEAALDEAVSTNVLEADLNGTGYRFHHGLMRAAIDDSLLPADRAHWHRGWAQLLDRDGTSDDPLDAIAAAHHWAQTRDDVRAFDAAARAAELAEAFGAESERAALLTRLLDLWSRVPDAEERAGRERDSVLVHVLSAHGGSGSTSDVEAAARLLDAELAQADARDMARRLWLRVELADCRENQGWRDVETFLGPGSTALNIVDAAQRDQTFVRAVTGLAARSLTERREESVSDLVSEAVQVATQVSDPLEQLMIRRHQVNILNALGRPEEALDMSAALVLWAGRQRPLAEVSVTESNHAFQLTVVGKFAEAVDLASHTLSRLQKPALSRWAWTFVVENLARALSELGQWDDAEDQLRTAMALNVDGEHHVFLEVEAGLIRSYRGDLEGAEAYLRSARSRLPDNALTWWTAAFMVHWLAAEVAAAKGHHAAARTEVASLLRHEEAVRTSLGWRVLLLAARIEAGTAGTPSSTRQTGADEGRDTMAGLLAFADALPAPGQLGPAWAAQLAAESRRFDGSAQASDWEAAAEGWRRTGQVHDEAWARLRLAGCLLASGDKERAAEALAAALAVGSRLGAKPLVDAVHEVAGRGRIPLDAAIGTPMSHRQFGLTQRELEVLRLVAEGYRNDQIAETLFISPKTASVHVSRILAKLGASTRTEATAVAHRHGLLDER